MQYLHILYNLYCVNAYLEIDNDSLVKECINGNPDALSLFYTRFAPKMYSVVMRYVTNPNDAEDILHDGFVVAFTRLKSLRNYKSVEYWLASIMKNLSLQFLQAQDVVTILHEIPEVEDTPEFNDIIDLPTLEALIQKLPKGYQTVFRLSVFENKTHKEIAKILGIAPNSSSSQLFHAKLMMRKLISDYRREAGVLSLLLVALTTGFIYWHNPKTLSPEKTAQTASIITPPSKETIKNTTSSPLQKIDKSNPNPRTLGQQNIASAKQISSPIAIPADTKTAISADTTTTCENTMVGLTETVSVKGDSIEIIPSEYIFPTPVSEEDLYAYDIPYPPKRTIQQNDWSLKMSVSTGLDISKLLEEDAFMNGAFGGDISSPEEDDKIHKPEKVRRSKRNYRDTAHSNDLPITVSATVNKSLSTIIGVETGLTYTYLHSTLESGAHTSSCSWHYLGIPLKVTINNFSNKRFKLYAAAGVQLDIPVYSTATTASAKNVTSLPRGRFHSPIVWSVAVSYGVSFNLTNHVGIFIEPSLQYHFDHNFEVPNTWTDNKLGFSLPIGLRFNF